MAKNEKRFIRIKKTAFAFIIIFAVSTLSFLGIQRYIANYSEAYYVTLKDAPEAEVIMVLGAYVADNGKPSYILRERLDYGYALYNIGKVKKILVSGDHGTKDYDEVNAMKEYLIGRGVPSEDIFMDHAGFNTYDSMYRAKEIFEIKTMIISTQDFHMDRSLYIARKLGIEAYGYPSEDKAFYNLRKFYIREGLARIKAFWDTDIIKRAPKYLGDKIPISGDGNATEG